MTQPTARPVDLNGPHDPLDDPEVRAAVDRGAARLAAEAAHRAVVRRRRFDSIAVHGMYGMEAALANGVTGAVLIMVAIALLISVRALTRVIRDLVNDPLKPTLSEVQAAVHDLRGTTEFITDTAVHPLLRVVAMGRGLKKGISIASSLGRKRE